MENNNKNEEEVKVTYVDDDGEFEERENFNVFFKDTKERRIARKIKGVIAPLCVLIFLAIGLFVPNSWGKAWLVFLAIPISEIFFSALRKTSKARIMYITLMSCIVIYVGLSVFLQWKGFDYAWLKSLIVFLIIPIVSALVR